MRLNEVRTNNKHHRQNSASDYNQSQILEVQNTNPSRIINQAHIIEEESKRAVEIDFIKQNQKFRERLAMRKQSKVRFLK